jgi:hypothetical protein
MRDEAVGSKGIVLETLCRICLRVCAAHPKIRGSPLWDVLGVTAIHSFRSAPPQLMLLLEQESWSASLTMFLDSIGTIEESSR